MVDPKRCLMSVQSFNVFALPFYGFRFNCCLFHRIGNIYCPSNCPYFDVCSVFWYIDDSFIHVIVFDCICKTTNNFHIRYPLNSFLGLNF